MLLRIGNIVLVKVVVEIVARILGIIHLLELKLGLVLLVIVFLLLLVEKFLLHLLIHLLLLLHHLKFFLLFGGGEDHLRRVALADDIERLLNVFQNHLARFFKASDLNLDNFSNGFFVLLDVLDTFIIFYHS